MQYFLNLCNINITLEIDRDINILDSAKEFYSSVPFGITDINVKMQLTDNINYNKNEGHLDGEKQFVEQMDTEDVYIYQVFDEKPYAHVSRNAQNPSLYICEYTSVIEARINHSNFVWDVLSLEALLLRYKGFILHSSFVKWQGMGILFSAPSGTGKSTQADLWKKYKCAEIINGDRVALKKNNDIWTAYGFPFAGSSQIYKNDNAPIGAIVVLEQAETNSLERLPVSLAFRKLYPEITIHVWDNKFVNEIINLLESVLLEVPIYILKCRPDQEAVDILSSELSTLYNLQGI